MMTLPPDAQTFAPYESAEDWLKALANGADCMDDPQTSIYARKVIKELTAERERGRRVREETIEEAAKECEHRAFLCHAHSERGKGQERGLLHAATYIRALARAESAPAGWKDD